MVISYNEIMKIFDFIIDNNELITENNQLFTLDTMKLMRNIVRGKIKYDFKLSKDQENLILKTFMNKEYTFDNDTPEIILKNYDLINKVIEKDIYNINLYSGKLTKELEEKVINIALEEKYTLSRSSPLFLKNNYMIALNSIRCNFETADYVEWDNISEKEQDKLIKEVINSDYVISYNSCIFILMNKDIVLKSLKKDINTVEYVLSEMKDNPEVFKYLITHGKRYSSSNLRDKPLSVFTEYETMNYAINQLNICNIDRYSFRYCIGNIPGSITENNKKYIERLSELYSEGIKKNPTIENFRNIIDIYIENEWNDYRLNFKDDYINVFGKITIELKNIDDFEYVLDNITFINKMQKSLGDKYYLLLKSMKEYHQIVHNNISLDNIDSCRDQIASLSALYVSIEKENFKKDKTKKIMNILKLYYIPKKNNQVIKKKIINNNKINKFKEIYKSGSLEIYKILDNIANKYDNKDNVWNMINNFLKRDYSKLNQFTYEPERWKEYNKFKEATKLINRLNNKYIKYTDKELTRYLDIINFDNGKYYYSGKKFMESEILDFKTYEQNLKIFNSIKKEIILEAKKLETDEEITDSDLINIASSLPFNDEYFEFNKNNIFDYDLSDFLYICTDEDKFINPINIIDDKTYLAIKNFIINNGLFWILLLFNGNKNQIYFDIYFDKKNVINIMESMEKIVSLAKIFNYDINENKNIFKLAKLSECADPISIAILGEKIIFKLAEHIYCTDNDITKIIDMAKYLVNRMAEKDKSTVPYVNGCLENYNYSVYDSQDETILTSGIDTDACFRIDGFDNDFLHYCAIDKNGFVLKITNSFGEFIGRASGFRNGNGIYFNQLRTIYDLGGIEYEGNSISEKTAIINTFKKACEDIVETSQKNTKETEKIDFVLVNKCYILKDEKSNVDTEIEYEIGNFPVENKSDDWQNFVYNTNNLQDLDINVNSFSLDYGNYSLICMATSKNFELNVNNIKKKDVNALYSRPRNKIICTNEINNEMIDKMNKIKAIYSYRKEIDFSKLIISDNEIFYLGDNWYIIHNGKNIVESCILDFDENAKIEYEATRKTISEYLLESENSKQYIKKI